MSVNLIDSMQLQDILATELPEFLSKLGKGEMHSVAYDTSWLARLSLKYPNQGFDDAYDWLLRAQRFDGSWGADVNHYHDRMVCTLSCVIALRLAGDASHDKRISKALNYIWHNIDRLYTDTNDTINFRGIASLLFSEAADLGLDVPQNVYFKHDKSGAKLSRLRSRPELWQRHPIAFSLECFNPTLADAESIIAANGSVGASPAASAAVLINSDTPNSRILDFLQESIQADGGIANNVPIDLFEIIWSLNVLRQANAIQPDDPAVKRCLDHIYQQWHPEYGLGHSSSFAAPDLDDASTAFAVLNWAGYPVSPQAFSYYEEADHFRCFADESDPSLSAHIRLLAALKMCPDYPETLRWIEKILGFLAEHAKANRAWTDKWHSSPFYLRSIAVSALHKLDNGLAAEHLRWILKTQHEDGGWGYFQRSTSEETAYALHALLYWHCHVAAVDTASIEQGVRYLLRHLDARKTPLWIGKCLYTPPQVVQAAILSALHCYAML